MYPAGELRCPTTALVLFCFFTRRSAYQIKWDEELNKFSLKTELGSSFCKLITEKQGFKMAGYLLNQYTVYM